MIKTKNEPLPLKTYREDGIIFLGLKKLVDLKSFANF